MINKFKSLESANFRKFAVITLFLFVEMIPAFGQKNILNDKHGWWYPIIQRHNIDLKSYNYSNSFTLVKPDTTFNERCIELGKSDSLKNRNVAFKDAIFISKGNNDNYYYIIKSAIAHHDFDRDLLVMEKSTMERFNLDSKDINPISSDSIDIIRFDIKNIRMIINQ
jgi:hypothetical protein